MYQLKHRQNFSLFGHLTAIRYKLSTRTSKAGVKMGKNVSFLSKKLIATCAVDFLLS